MSKRASSQLLNDGSSSSSSSSGDNDNNSKKTMVSLYNNNGVAISEMPVNDDNDNDIGGGGDDGKMLCIFDSRKKPRLTAASWVDEFHFNLKCGNPSVVICDTPENDLDDIMMFIKNKLNIEKWMSRLFPLADHRVSIEKAKPPRVINQIGLRVYGGLMQFYFCDEVMLKYYTGKHGPFIIATWSKMSLYNEIVANFIKCYNQWDKDDLIKMQDNVLLNVPEHGERHMYVRKFYDIRRNKNEEVYNIGIRRSQKQLVCDMFDEQRFDEVFGVNLEDNRPCVKMTMYAVLEGYKIGKEQELETVYNKKVTEKPYSVAIQPICFFNIET
ncbi:DNA-binding protein 2 [Trabala vishnou gigantina nucleopolyhedrovirus]|uniref:DNA-binding protein 2 n=1 Tax=Trabala vishnou gigantina nucleopolyhedrovirus TaxID=2863583 RepID=UPI0024820774|nr:DNA-binding protein 2 [Trabala vishnou gigantina nucleopolyhedrovirus]QYC92703.1 DNA-binding protein 2 [Trabala vishnou gigantina nucleopolyhedrovirus]